MKNFFIRTIFLTLILSTSACISYGNKQGNEYTKDQVSKLKVNKTTYAEAIEILGPPSYNNPKNSFEYSVLFYQFSKVQGSASITGWMPIIGFTAEQKGGIPEGKSLYLEFKKNVLTDIKEHNIFDHLQKR